MTVFMSLAFGMVITVWVINHKSVSNDNNTVLIFISLEFQLTSSWRKTVVTLRAAPYTYGLEKVCSHTIHC